MPLTYPHSIISKKCEEKYKNKWDILECNVNSLQIYYGNGEKTGAFVEIEKYKYKKD